MSPEASYFSCTDGLVQFCRPLTRRQARSLSSDRTARSASCARLLAAEAELPAIATAATGTLTRHETDCEADSSRKSCEKRVASCASGAVMRKQRPSYARALSLCEALCSYCWQRLIVCRQLRIHEHLQFAVSRIGRVRPRNLQRCRTLDSCCQQTHGF